MTESPAPLVPPEIDLSKIDGFMLDTVRLLGSELVAISTGEEFKAAVLLWARSWHQRPAASLPDDDRVLASFAMVPAARWKKVKPIALRGFVKCSDGRLYHRVLAEDAVRAWGRVLQRRAAINSRYGKKPPGGTGEPTAVEPPNNGDGYDTSTVDGTVTGRDGDEEESPKGERTQGFEKLSSALSAAPRRLGANGLNGGTMDHGNRKALWFSRVLAFVKSQAPDAEVQALLAGYLADEPKAKAAWEVWAKREKAARKAKPATDDLERQRRTGA